MVSERFLLLPFSLVFQSVMALGGQSGDHSNNRVVVSSQSTSMMKDTSSSFYLYNRDHLGLVLFTHSLTGSNYNT